MIQDLFSKIGRIMDNEKHTLTWHTYPDHLRGIMRDMMRSEDFADVTLVTNDKKSLKAHRNILSACSPFFNTVLLNSDPEKKKLLHPKLIPTSQCYYCTLIFNNFEMFRMKTFEIKPQTGGVNA